MLHIRLALRGMRRCRAYRGGNCEERRRRVILQPVIILLAK